MVDSCTKSSKIWDFQRLRHLLCAQSVTNCWASGQADGYVQRRTFPGGWPNSCHVNRRVPRIRIISNSIGSVALALSDPSPDLVWLVQSLLVTVRSWPLKSVFQLFFHLLCINLWFEHFQHVLGRLGCELVAWCPTRCLLFCLSCWC